MVAFFHKTSIIRIILHCSYILFACFHTILSLPHLLFLNYHHFYIYLEKWFLTQLQSPMSTQILIFIIYFICHWTYPQCPLYYSEHWDYLALKHNMGTWETVVEWHGLSSKEDTSEMQGDRYHCHSRHDLDLLRKMATAESLGKRRPVFKSIFSLPDLGESCLVGSNSTSKVKMISLKGLLEHCYSLHLRSPSITYMLKTWSPMQQCVDVGPPVHDWISAVLT